MRAATIFRHGRSARPGSGSRGARLARLLLGGGIAWAWLFAGAAAAETSLYFSVERLGLDEGLSQLTVTALAEDDRGFLWVGTQEGLNRFDGHRFAVQRARRGDPDGPISSSVDALAFDERSRLWIGTNDAGLEVLDLRSQQRRRVGQGEGLSHPTVQRILVDREGGAWLGTPAGVDHVDSAVTAARRLGGSEPIVAMAWAGDVPVALGRRCGVWRLARDAIHPLPAELPADSTCMALAGAPEGLWVGTSHGAQLLSPQGHVLRTLRLPATEPGIEVTALEQVGDDLLLGLADGTLLRAAVARQEGVQPVALDQPLESAVTVIFRHSSGVLWLGTHTAGLFRVRALSATVRRDLVSDADVAAWPSRSVRSIWVGGEHLMVGTDVGLMQRRGRAT
jgi:ligand-binding sensor domain-containing protein